jgi:hypothetical protein
MKRRVAENGTYRITNVQECDANAAIQKFECLAPKNVFLTSSFYKVQMGNK